MNKIKHITDSYLRGLQIVFFTVVVMYIGKALFIPLSFALLIALIIYPICKWFEDRKLPRSVAIVITLTIVTLLLGGLILLLMWQINYLKADAPFLAQKIQTALQQSQQWFNAKVGTLFNLDTTWLENTSQNFGFNIGSFVQDTLNTMGGFLFSLFIIPVYTTLFLYHREQFIRFLKSLIDEKYHQTFQVILRETIYTYHNYIIGLIKIYLIVGVLNSIGLLLLGIKYAFLFGMLTAFMTMIPYAGIIISSLLPITVAWVTTDSWIYPLGVVAVFAVVQYLESSVIFPKVVGEQLNVSTWTILVALLAGGLIWGVSGMILLIPFVAILKILSSKIEGLQPLNILLSRTEKEKTPMEKETEIIDKNHLFL